MEARSSMESSQSPAPSTGSPPPTATTPKIRRRNRIITSCLECRRRKLKCDRAHPCNHCQKAKRDCVFLAPSLDANSKNKLNQFKESVDYLEKGLRFSQDDQGAFPEWNVSSQSQPDGINSRPKEDIPADEKGLEPTPLALPDIVYDDEVDNIIDDLGVRFGKVRITERIGGFVRPRFSEELTDTVRLNPDFQPQLSQDHAELLESSAGQSTDPYRSEDSQSWLEPTAEYIAPGLGLTFPFQYTEDVSLLSFLPSKDFADKLLERYWFAVHPIARAVHRPSFEKQYHQFWQDVSMGYEPLTSLQALVFAAMFSATVSLSDEAALLTFRCSRLEMIKTFRMGCEFALSKSNLLRTTRLSVIQAFVMYLIPLCRAEVSRAHASLVSMAVRLAECAGLHRDGTQFSLSPIETHVRRILWHQLIFLDYRVCMAVGPRPTIHDGEWDTKMPLNVDDRELMSLVSPTQDASRYTDITISRIRFENTLLQRLVWNERTRIEKGETSLSSLLRKIEDWKDRMWKQYHPLLDESKPEQAFAARFMQLAVCGARIGVLHRYVVSTTQQPPERLVRHVWSSGTRNMEIAIELESSPAFAPMFGWYMGAHVQWHVALLFIPLLAMQEKPAPETDRVWAALDYIFELPPSMSRSDKIRFAFTVARSRLEEAQKQRRTRLPTLLEQRLGSAARSSTSATPQTDTRRRNSTSPLPANIQVTAPTPGQETNDQLPFGSDTSFGLTHAYSTSSSSSPSLGNGRLPNVSQGFDSYMQPNFAAPGDMALNMGDSQLFNSGDKGQNFNMVDWEEMERIIPLDDSNMFSETQIFHPADSGAAQSTEGSAWTLLPQPPWERQARGQQ